MRKLTPDHWRDISLTRRERATRVFFHIGVWRFKYE